MTWKVLVSAPRMLLDMEQLRPRFRELGWDLLLAEHVVQRLDESQLLELVGDVDATICGGDQFTARVMDGAPRLKAICKWGTGTDAIDIEAALSRGIAVRNVPDAFSVPVGDTTMALILTFARQVPWVDRRVKAGQWERIEGISLAECTLGVVGVGNIGSTVLRRARAFGMRCLGCDPKQPPFQVLDDTGVQMVELDVLLREADFVSVHCDLNSTSRHLLSDREFSLMKKSAVLINTARGPIVDEPALIRALQSTGIAGAGIDVFEHEPPRPDNPLLSMDNVLLSPHQANTSDRACWRVHERVIQNVIDLLEPPMVDGR